MLAKLPASADLLAQSVPVPARDVAAAFLGRVERLVGVLQQRLGGRAVLRRDRDADAGPHDAAEAAFLHFDQDAVEEPLRGLGHLQLVVDDREDRDELVAAEPSDEVVAPDAVAHPTTRLDQRLVADRVAEGVVDRLEAVEVDEQHADPSRAALGRSERVVEMTQRRGARGQVGERIDRALTQRFGLVLVAQQQPSDGAADRPRNLVVRRAAAGVAHGEHVRRGRGQPADVAAVVEALARRDRGRFGRELGYALFRDVVGRDERHPRPVGAADERNVRTRQRQRAGQDHTHQIGGRAS